MITIQNILPGLTIHLALAPNIIVRWQNTSNFIWTISFYSKSNEDTGVDLLILYKSYKVNRADNVFSRLKPESLETTTKKTENSWY